MSEQRIVNIADLRLHTIGNGGKFAGQAGRAGPMLGLQGLACTLIVLPPGKAMCPMHRHHTVDEAFFILDGEGVTRLDDRTLPIRSGDLVAAPAGREAHQIVNTGSRDLRYLAIATEGPTDIIEYPDSGKLMVAAMVAKDADGEPSIDRLGRLAPAAYFDGEDLDQ